MKRSDITVGMSVVTSDMPNATIYTVMDLHGYSVRLQHPTREDIVMTVDYLMVHEPSELQRKVNN